MFGPPIDLGAAMKAAGSSFAGARRGANFTIAVRRAVRSGDAEGMLIEDTGISGQPYSMTQRDVFESNADLIEYCARLLAEQPGRDSNVVRNGRRLKITTAGLDRIDIYADGHPAGPSRPLKWKQSC